MTLVDSLKITLNNIGMCKKVHNKTSKYRKYILNTLLGQGDQILSFIFRFDQSIPTNCL